MVDYALESICEVTFPVSLSGKCQNSSFTAHAGAQERNWQRKHPDTTVELLQPNILWR